jgi:hypothetical protein
MPKALLGSDDLQHQFDTVLFKVKFHNSTSSHPVSRPRITSKRHRDHGFAREYKTKIECPFASIFTTCPDIVLASQYSYLRLITIDLFSIEQVPYL